MFSIPHVNGLNSIYHLLHLEKVSRAVFMLYIDVNQMNSLNTNMSSDIKLKKKKKKHSVHALSGAELHLSILHIDSIT